MSIKIRLLLIPIIIFLASAETAFACSALKFGEPPCALWTRADVVFSGKVLKIESVPAGEGFAEGSRKVRFQVTQNFKGADNPTFAVVIKNSTEAGGANIKKGETWIIYARTDIVGKSFAEFRRVRVEPKETNAELETLRSIVAGKTSSAIAGRIAQSDAQTIEVTVEGGGKTFTAKTDTDGAFNVAVPYGNYKVELRFPYRAAVKWDENLLGASLTEGAPTVFRYDVRLNDGDCHFGFFEVLKR